MSIKTRIKGYWSSFNFWEIFLDLLVGSEFFFYTLKEKYLLYHFTIFIAIQDSGEYAILSLYVSRIAKES